MEVMEKIGKFTLLVTVVPEKFKNKQCQNCSIQSEYVISQNKPLGCLASPLKDKA